MGIVRERMHALRAVLSGGSCRFHVALYGEHSWKTDEVEMTCNFALPSFMTKRHLRALKS